MNFQSAGYQLLPVLPELVLATGAMVLLMLGAYGGQDKTRTVTWLSIVLLVGTGVLELALPAGKVNDSELNRSSSACSEPGFSGSAGSN